MNAETKGSVLIVTGPDGPGRYVQGAMTDLRLAGYHGRVIDSGRRSFGRLVQVVQDEARRRLPDGPVTMLGPKSAGLAVISALEGLPRSGLVAATAHTDVLLRSEPSREVPPFEAEGRRVVGGQMIRGALSVDDETVVNVIGGPDAHRQWLDGAKVLFTLPDSLHSPLGGGLHRMVDILNRGGFAQEQTFPSPPRFYVGEGWDG